MSTVGGVTHPGVSHPPTGPADVADKPTMKPRGKPDGKRFAMPRPQVLAAGVLAVAAVELLLWQVAGPGWAVAVHAVFALLFALVLFVVVRLRRRGQRGDRRRRDDRRRRRDRGERNQAGPLATIRSLLGGRGGRSPQGRGAPSGRGPGATPAGRRGPLSRLAAGARRALSPGGGRAPASGATPGGGGATPKRKPGLLSRLGWPGAGGGATPKRKGATPSGGGATPKGGRTTPGGKGGLLSRLLLGAGGGATPGGGKGSPQKPDRKKKSDRTGPDQKRKPDRKGSGWWRRFRDGLDEGARDADRAAAKVEEKVRRKPSPHPRDEEPTVDKSKGDKSAEVKPDPDRWTDPEPDWDTDWWTETKRSPATTPKVAAPVAASTTGGTMSNPGTIRDLADQFGAACKAYEPETMHEMVRDIPSFGEALETIASGFRAVAARAESEWPVAPAVVEALNSIAADVQAAAGTAEAARQAARSENETDIERGEAPRKGSREVESKWNV